MLFVSHKLGIKRKLPILLLTLTLLSILSLTTAQQALISSLTSTATPPKLKVEVNTQAVSQTHLPKVERQFTQDQHTYRSIQQPSPTYFLTNPAHPVPTETTTQILYLTIPPAPPGPSPFLHPLAIILILCSILGFISTLIYLPFATFAMSSSSSSAKPSSSSSKPSSSSSSSSSRPSSSSSGSGSSSSSSSSSKPSSAPQPLPTISANAWMSFFLFCCLVLIILQGPLGLTGGNILPSFSTLPSFGYGYGYGVMPGCAGMVSTYVPWCQQQPVPQTVQQPSQIQVQQVVQNTPGSYGVGPAPMAAPQYQMGGQGGFASPNGGGGWSWYSNAGSVGGQVVRQQPGYYPAQQRTVQYQRPGLQIQIDNARGGNAAVPQHVAPQYYYNTCPTYQYQNPYQYRLPYGYTTTTTNRCTPWQPWKCHYLPPIFAYAHSLPAPSIPNGNGMDIHIGGGANVNIQSQHVGSGAVIQPRPVQSIPALPVTPPPQPVLPPPSAMASISNLENAFYPLLVGAIALLVVFDYAS